MKKYWIIFSIILALVMIILSGEIIHFVRNLNIKPTPSAPDVTFKHVEPIGEIPEEFKNIIHNNFFDDISAFDDKLIKVERIPLEDGSNDVHHRILLTDLYANTLCQYELNTNKSYFIRTYLPTSDGGFLFVLGFTGEIPEISTQTSEYGYASHVIKVDSTGNLQFSTPFEKQKWNAFEYCFEKDQNFYFFGGTSLSSENRLSTDDIFMTLLNGNGFVLKTHVLSGSDYDFLRFAETIDDHFLLSITSHSEDGDFSGLDSSGDSTNWIFTINEQLDISEKKHGQGTGMFTFQVGIIDGSPVYNTDDRFKDYDAGSPEVYIDYGDFYLIVSKNDIGINYEEIDPGSGYTYYTETVYSAHKHTGELLFRSSSDVISEFDIQIQSADSQ